MLKMFATITEASELLGVHERTVRRWIVAGKLPSRRLGRTIRIPIEALENFGDSGAWDGGAN